MAKAKTKIKVISYCYVGDQLVCTDDLNEEQKERLAVGLQWGLLTTRFGGVATINPPPGFECSRTDNGLIKVTRTPVTA